MVMQIRRTRNGGPPNGLAPGQLAVEMVNPIPKLWVGVPPTVTAAEQLLVSDITQEYVNNAVSALRNELITYITTQLGALTADRIALQPISGVTVGNVQAALAQIYGGGVVPVVSDGTTILGDGTTVDPLKLAFEAVTQSYVDERINTLRQETAARYVRIAGVTPPDILPPTPSALLATEEYVDLAIAELRAEIAEQYVRIAGVTPPGITPPGGVPTNYASQAYVNLSINALRAEIAAQYVRIGT